MQKKTAQKVSAAAAQNSDLTEAEKDFCLHYCFRPNAARAYRLAYPDAKPAIARREGWQLRTKPNIQAEIARLNQIRREQMLASVAADEVHVFQMMWDIAFQDMTDFVAWGKSGKRNYVTFHDSGEVDGTLVAEVKQGREGVSVKLPDRMAALKWLADYFEMNPADRRRADFDERKLRLEEGRVGMESAEIGNITFEIVPAPAVCDDE